MNAGKKNVSWQTCPFIGLPVEIAEIRSSGAQGATIRYQCLTRIAACRPEICPLFGTEGSELLKNGPYELPYRDEGGFCNILFSALGGDGANTAAKLLFELAVTDMNLDGGLDAKYGSEKTGTPTDVSIRLTDQNVPVRASGPTRRPHILVIFHLELARPLKLLDGLAEDASVIVNTSLSPAETREKIGLHSGMLYTMDATKIALETNSRLNMPFLAQVCRVMGIPDASLEGPITRRWPKQSEANLRAFHSARASVRAEYFEADGKFDLRPPSTRMSRIGYQTMLPGSAIRALEFASVPESGSRRSITPPPAFKREACIDCVLCLTVCPDPGSLIWKDGRMEGINAAYCKACMRCVSVCPQTKNGKALTLQ